MRYLAFLLAFLVGVFIGVSGARAAELAEDAPFSALKTNSDEIPQAVIDEALTALILGDEKLCCRVERLDQKIGELVWGPLYWRRLKILCPGIRPVAIC